MLSTDIFKKTNMYCYLQLTHYFILTGLKVDPIFYFYYHLNKFQFLTHFDQYNFFFFLTPTKCYIGTHIQVDPDSFDKTSIRQIVIGFLEMQL